MLRGFPPIRAVLHRLRVFFVTLVALISSSIVGQAAIVFVKADATNVAANGITWTSAFPSLQEGINAASPHDEIWVASGIYLETVRVLPGIAIYGGFHGGETNRTERDWMRHPTVIDASQTNDWRWFPADLQPASAVCFEPGATPETRLDGFTIRNGAGFFGAGIYVGGGSPVIANNQIFNNTASGIAGGGGILCDAARGLSSETAPEFLKRVASLLLEPDFGISATNIPLCTNGSAWTAGGQRLYSASVHRCLQMAANLWDAAHPGPYPTVFRPQFETRGGDVFITNYVEEIGTGFLNRPWHDLDDSSDRSVAANDNVYGAPFVIGVKKGLPALNKVSIQSFVEFRRQIEVRKNTSGQLIETNTMFLVAVSNYAVVAAWNPYEAPYPRSVDLIVGWSSTGILTNDGGLVVSNRVSVGATRSIAALTWTNMMLTPLMTTALVPASVYRGLPSPHFELLNPWQTYEVNLPGDTNRWGMSLTNRVVAMLIDNGRVIDLMNFGGITSSLDISTELMRRTSPSHLAFARLWDPAPQQFAPYISSGSFYQLEISRGVYGVPSSQWLTEGWFYSAGFTTAQAAVQAFSSFLQTNTPGIFAMQTPFNAARRLTQTITLEANDPLVHYTPADLMDLTNATIARVPLTGWSALTNLLQRSRRYAPWGGYNGYDFSDPLAFESSVKDYGIWAPDFWDFPADTDLNLRWLDRVHRGTPWQTVYVDAPAASSELWNWHTGAAFDLRTHPTNDWRLMELFLKNELMGGGVQPSAPVIANNTIVANTAQAGGGITVVPGSAPTLINNIIAFGSSGVRTIDGGMPVLKNNCFFGNLGVDYTGTAAGVGDFIGAPRLVSVPGADFRLMADSTCIDAGDDTVTALGWVERSGPTAIQRAHIDVGAAEFGPTGVPVITRLVRVPGSGEISATLRGFPGQTYIIESSEDLRAWSSLSTNTASSAGELIFSGPILADPPHRFFRAVLR